MKRPRRVLGCGLFVLTMGIALDAEASSVLINDINDDFVVNYSLGIGGGNTLSAVGTYDVLSITSTQVQLQVTIQNTTNPSLGEVVSSIGFNTNPAVTASFVSAGAVFDGLGNDTNFPSFQTIQVCVFTSNNCSSSAFGQALQPGSSDTFTLNLGGSFGATPSVTLSTFAIKFAGQQGSFETEGVAVVPIPGTFLLFGAGLAGFAAWHLREKQRSESRKSC